MKSLTEAQLKELLREAWEDGGNTFWGAFPLYTPFTPSDQVLKEREELFQMLIDGV